jgi:hypothetical protein
LARLRIAGGYFCKIVFMKKNYLLLFYLVALIFGCNESGKGENDCIKIQQILIINRGANEYLVDSTIVRDRTAINEYCDLLSKAVAFGDRPNVKSGFGFFELIVSSKENRKQSLDVIYTVYDGVIIRDYKGKYLKQDKFIDYILRNAKEK